MDALMDAYLAALSKPDPCHPIQLIPDTHVFASLDLGIASAKLFTLDVGPKHGRFLNMCKTASFKST